MVKEDEVENAICCHRRIVARDAGEDTVVFSLPASRVKDSAPKTATPGVAEDWTCSLAPPVRLAVANCARRDRGTCRVEYTRKR